MTKKGHQPCSAPECIGTIQVQIQNSDIVPGNWMHFTKSKQNRQANLNGRDHTSGSCGDPAPWPQLQEIEAVRAEEIPGVLPAAIEVLGAIRGAKTEARRSLKWPVTALLIGGAEADRGSLGAALDDVLAAGNVDPGVFSWADVSPEEGQRFKVDVTLGDEPSAP